MARGCTVGTRQSWCLNTSLTFAMHAQTSRLCIDSASPVGKSHRREESLASGILSSDSGGDGEFVRSLVNAPHRYTLGYSLLAEN